MQNEEVKGNVQYEANEGFPQKLSSYEYINNYVEIKTENRVTLRIYVLEQDMVRLRYATQGVFENDFSYAIDPGYTSSNPKPELEETAVYLFVKTSSFIVRVDRSNLSICFLDTDGLVINEDEKGFHWEENAQYGGNIVQVSKKVQQQESFFGLGDKPVDQNLRGKRFMNWGTDEYGYNKGTDPIYKNINVFYGYHSGRCYGIFMDNTFKSFFDFASERKTVASFWADGGEMNYYFIYGPEPLSVVQRYTKLTGTPEMPPMWALGYQQCKWSYYPESNVREICGKLRENRIPCDAIYLDIDYMDGFRCFTWDKEKFADPKKMVADLKEDGFQTMVIIDPGIKIDFDYDVFKEGFDKGYFCRRADGPFVKGKVWPGDCYFPDYTRPEVREWWATLFEGLIKDVGVAGVWNDMNEPALFEVKSKTFPDDVRHDYDGNPCSHRKGHNVYGMQMARATLEGIKKFSGDKRTLVITRSGYNGLQRYSSVWTGDNLATWEHLVVAHLQTQRLSISGISFNGSDIGGFIGHPSGELYVRWVQQAIFHPFFRTHSSGDHGDQEPWSFGPEYMDYARKFIELRYELLPYIYTTFYQYHKDGLPMLRPLLFSDMKDPDLDVNREDECLFGDNILFCPIMQPSSTGRTVKLPRGEWYDYFSNERYEGGKEHFIFADLNKMPIFVRAGSVIPHFPLMQYTGEKKVEEVILKYYVGEDNRSSAFYADAYDGYSYLDGDFRLANFLSTKNGKEIFIKQDCVNDTTTEHSTYKIEVIGLNGSSKKVLCDGEDCGNVSVEGGILTLRCDIGFKEIIIEKD